MSFAECIVLSIMAWQAGGVPLLAQDGPHAEVKTLPDAPQPAHPLIDGPTRMPEGVSAAPPAPDVTLRQCPYVETNAPVCRVHIRQLVISAAVFNAFQNAANLYTGYWYRYETMHGKWWDRYVNSVEGWRWNRWADNNPFLDDYVGHPMMGSITDYLWRQNDPRSMTLVQSNTWPYWRGLLRSTAFSAFYSFEWKLGPFGEAGVGHNGDHPIHDAGIITNETGWVELVTTPVGGTLWTMAEDALDKHVITRLEGVSRDPFALLSYQFLSPARATANILRFRPPWYRDSRTVKADSFWSEPPAPDVLNTEPASTAPSKPAGSPPATTFYGLPPRTPVQRATTTPALPEYAFPGDVHEFGAWWGLSLMDGHIWGYAKDVKYMPIDLRYSYQLERWRHWTMRYSPEMTALAMLDEPVPNQSDPKLKRKRTYGSGLSPFGFQSDFFPSSRVQPFLSTNGGFIYFTDRVLSPQGRGGCIRSISGAGSISSASSGRRSASATATSTCRMRTSAFTIPAWMRIPSIYRSPGSAPRAIGKSFLCGESAIDRPDNRDLLCSWISDGAPMGNH